MLGQFKDLYKLRSQAKEIKKKLEKINIEAEQDGVTIIINGEQEVQEVRISDEAMSDKRKLEKTLVNCMNKGVKKAQQVGAEMMKDVMGGLNLPGLGQ